MRELLNYTQFGTDRIQLIINGDIVFLEGTPLQIVELNKLFSDANNNLNDEELWKKVEYRISNAPQEYFGKFKRDRGGNLYFRDYDEVIEGAIGKRVEIAKETNDMQLVTSLENFTALNMLNVNAQARKDLYSFMAFHGIVTTPKGYLVAYKAVGKMKPKLSKPVQDALEKFKFDHNDEDWLICEKDKYTSISFLDIPNKQTKMNFAKNNEGKELIGKFEDLYQDLEDLKNGIFVDKHTGTVQQRVGDVLSMPRVDCDPDSSVGCSVGFHVGSPEYVNWYGSKGDIVLHCLVNPADVVAVPSHDVRKIRTCQYYICGFSEVDKSGKIVPIDTNLFEHDYATIEKEQIEDELLAGDFSKYIDPRVESTSIEQAQKIIDKRLNLIK
jgi:hypothetical protein